MTISRERFELALERLKDSDWERFENLASAFLASDFPMLRTMASSSGDGGRDSELFSPVGEPGTVFQYSVQQAWQPKVQKTLVRLQGTFPEAKKLHYVTNQEIGAKADKLKREAFKSGIYLDIMDRSWFLDRANLDAHRAEAALALAKVIVDPLLESKGVLINKSSPLSRNEARTALVFLELQRQDEVAGKNLTRSSFDALVRAALHGSTRDSRITRQEIYRRVCTFLPRHSEQQLRPFVDAALSRLKKSAISEWGADGSFHISHTEAERIKDSSARLILQKSAFEADVVEIVQTSMNVSVADPAAFLVTTREIIETYFLRRGEEFAGAVAGDRPPPVHETDIRQIVSQMTKPRLVTGRDAKGYMLHVVTSILNNPSPATLEYLKVMADSYTLMSFLNETPDVQAVTKKLFSHGEIWLDTTVLLPLFVEKFVTESSLPFTTIFSQTKKAGAKLYVSRGVIEEIERHLNRSLQCARSTQWQGDTPYVYGRYVIAGGKPGSFASWLEQFRGDYSPEQDIADYLGDFGILVEEAADPSNVPADVRAAITSYWQEVQDRRRRSNERYNLISDRLAQHDIENCLTVLSSRMGETGRSPLGHKSWWLTLDSAAFRMASTLDRDAWIKIKHSPVLSLDFLVKYLSFGPARDLVPDAEKNISRVFSTAIIETLPVELIKVAEKVREDCSGLAERLVQRRIRDALDQAKATIGAVHQGGLEKIEQAILSTF